MMQQSIVCTAIPSLGRLVVELQPEVNAFAITDQHGVRKADTYAPPSFDHRFPSEYARKNKLGTPIPRSLDEGKFQATQKVLLV